MTNDEIVDVIWQLKQQVFWPHLDTIAADCQRAIATISHLEDRITALTELVEQVTRNDSATVNVENAINARRWRDKSAKLMAQLDQALAEARGAKGLRRNARGDWAMDIDPPVPMRFSADHVELPLRDIYPHTEGDAA